MFELVHKNKARLATNLAGSFTGGQESRRLLAQDTTELDEVSTLSAILASRISDIDQIDPLVARWPIFRYIK